MRKPQPRKCLESKPTTQTVVFAGVPINLTQISRKEAITQSALSHIFSGRRRPSLMSTVKISGALGMTMDAFITALVEHVYKDKQKVDSQ